MHLWDRGVLNSSSWHGLEELGTFASAQDLIVAGNQSGAWPAVLSYQELRTPGGILAPSRAIVGSYCAHPDRVIGVVGDRYTANTPEDWRELVRAAVEAGAVPTGAFSLRDGSTVLATFEVNDRSNGISTQLLLTDSFDGSSRLTAGFTSVRVVCANTLARAMSQDGRGMAQLRHTSSIAEKVAALREQIGEAVKSGHAVADLYRQASAVQLSRGKAQALFDALFPPAKDDASPAVKTRADNLRAEAQRAAALPINAGGPTVATLWNAATYLVDRRIDGTPRPVRSGEPLDSLLFGARGQRLDEVQTIVEYIMRDGSVQGLPISQAIETDGAKQDFAALMGQPSAVL